MTSPAPRLAWGAGSGDQDHAGDGGEDANAGEQARLVAGEEGGGDRDDGAAGGDRGDDRHGPLGQATVEQHQGQATADPGDHAPGDPGRHGPFALDNQDQQGGGEGNGAGRLAPEGDGQRRQPAGLDAAEEVRRSPAQAGTEPERNAEVHGRPPSGGGVNPPLVSPGVNR